MKIECKCMTTLVQLPEDKFTQVYLAMNNEYLMCLDASNRLWVLSILDYAEKYVYDLKDFLTFDQISITVNSQGLIFFIQNEQNDYIEKITYTTSDISNLLNNEPSSYEKIDVVLEADKFSSHSSGEYYAIVYYNFYENKIFLCVNWNNKQVFNIFEIEIEEKITGIYSEYKKNKIKLYTLIGDQKIFIFRIVSNKKTCHCLINKANREVHIDYQKNILVMKNKDIDLSRAIVSDFMLGHDLQEIIKMDLLSHLNKDEILNELVDKLDTSLEVNIERKLSKVLAKYERRIMFQYERYIIKLSQAIEEEKLHSQKLRLIQNYLIKNNN